MKKIIALIMTVVLAFSVMSVSVYAEDAAENIIVTVDNVEFIFEAGTSEDFRNKFIADYFNTEDDGTETYGLTCTLFGHNLETSTSIVITHKVNSTSPRCLQEKYLSEACTRCDYTSKTLVSSTYIVCC